MSTPAEAPASRGEIARMVAVVLPSRFVMNTAYRMGYAFLPEFGRGLGVDLQTMSTLVTARSSIGLTAPIFGPLADRYGRRAAMLAALVLFIICSALAFTASALWWFAAGFVGLSIAKVIFDPSASAYLADRVPYERRGLVLGINELGWAGAGFLGVPLMAQAIERIGWQSPFGIVAAAGVVALGWAFFMLPRDGARAPGAHTDVRAAFAAIRANRSALIMLSVTGLYMTGAEMIGVTYAAWLERAFNADVLMIGGIAATFGIADVVGEVISMWGVDRFGKKRSLLAGLICVVLSYFSLPFLGGSLPLAITGLFIYYVCFEFTVVSVYPLVTELVPEARATLMSLSATSSYVGRMAGAPIGAFLFAAAGFGANGIAAGLCVAAATAIFAFGVHERKAKT